MPKVKNPAQLHLQVRLASLVFIAIFGSLGTWLNFYGQDIKLSSFRSPEILVGEASGEYPWEGPDGITAGWEDGNKLQIVSKDRFWTLKLSPSPMAWTSSGKFTLGVSTSADPIWQAIAGATAVAGQKPWEGEGITAGWEEQGKVYLASKDRYWTFQRSGSSWIETAFGRLTETTPGSGPVWEAIRTAPTVAGQKPWEEIGITAGWSANGLVGLVSKDLEWALNLSNMSWFSKSRFADKPANDIWKKAPKVDNLYPWEGSFGITAGWNSASSNIMGITSKDREWALSLNNMSWFAGGKYGDKPASDIWKQAPKVEIMCTTGATKCSGNSVQACNAQGVWVNQQSCSASQTCFQANCIDIECTSIGATQCSGNKVQLCDKPGTWTDQYTCGADQSCGAGVCRDISISSSAPSLAVEAMHYDSNGSIRNVRGFYKSDTRHFATSIFHNFTFGSLVYNHSIAVLDTSGNSNQVVVRYYDTDKLVKQTSFTLPAHGFKVIGSGVGLPANFLGSVVVESGSSSVVEVQTFENNSHSRSYGATPQRLLAKKYYMPIVYDRVFERYGSTLTIQNPNIVPIPAGGVRVTITCQDGDREHHLNNSREIKPYTFYTFPLKVPDSLLVNRNGFNGFCENSVAFGNIKSVLFGHGEVESDYLITGDVAITNGSTNTSRQEGLARSLSKILFVPSTARGTWQGLLISTSLNISNPNSIAANVFVDSYRINASGEYYLDETRRPQLFSPGKTACDGVINNPIPANGERSFVYHISDNDPTQCDSNKRWGVGDQAFGFSIIKSDRPVTASNNQANNNDDFAEIALGPNDLSSTVYIPQLYANYSNPAVNSRISVLNPSDNQDNYDFDFYNQQGTKVHSYTTLIKSKSVHVASLSGLPNGNRFSLKISPTQTQQSCSSTAMCLSASCAPNAETQCDGSTPQICNSSGSGWDTGTNQEVCGSNKECSSGSCVCSAGFYPSGSSCVKDCDSGQTDTASCSVTNGTGSKTRSCSGNGQWGSYGSCNLQSCNSGYHQDSGACVVNATPTPTPTPAACPGDYTNDNDVNIQDLFHVLSNWGVPDPGGQNFNISQLLGVLREWGGC